MGETGDDTAVLPFGHWIFQGQFAARTFTGFNPDYQINVGDMIDLRLWGGFEFTGQMRVDEQGNAFLPRVGPVALLGVRNSDLNRVVNETSRTVFERNVSVYASLSTSQKVKVYVAGFVAAPGLYEGNAADSVLAFLDRAGGIRSQQGSYRNIQILAGDKSRATVDLYAYLLEGRLSLLQMHDGDVILVPARGPSVVVTGSVDNSYEFEFAQAETPMASILAMARPHADATHARLTKASGTDIRVQFSALDAVAGTMVADGDRVELVSDRRPAQISVRIEGENVGLSEFVVPYGTRLGEVLEQVTFGTLADRASISLRRLSIQQRQRQRLDLQLKNLESAVLNARSRTAEEASLRQMEAELVLQWIERAKALEPRGLLVLAGHANVNEVPLESGDVIVIPRRDPTVMVHGEVLFPTAVLWSEGQRVGEYIDQSGGFTELADKQRVLILHSDGTFDSLDQTRKAGNPGSGQKGGGRPYVAVSREPEVRPGDEILVLPHVDFKSLQVTKDVSQVLYQLALSTAVVLALF